MHSPRSLVLGLLAVSPAEGAPVQGLIGAAAVLDISANNLRVLLARLKRDRLVETTRRGCYRLSTEARAVQDQVDAWRDVEQQIVPWNGRWIGAFTGGLPRSNRSAASKRLRALRLLGFRQLESGLYIRPDNLAGSVASVRVRLHKLGLEEQALVCILAGLDGGDAERVLSLWDADQLDASYRQMERKLVATAERIGQLRLEQAAREAFLVGGEAIRQIALDPLLPEPIVDCQLRGRFFTRMREFDLVGRSYWKAVLGQWSQSEHRREVIHA